MTGMETFDFVVIGAGPAGEAAAHKARELGATRRRRRPALVRRVVPAHRLRPVEGAAPRRGAPLVAARTTRGERASERRDYMVNRPAGAAEPDDTLPRQVARVGRRGRVSGATGRITARGASSVTATTATAHELARARTSSSRSGRRPRCRRSRASPTPTPGRTSRRRSPASCPRASLVLGGGPTGCELAQVYRAVRRPDDDLPVRPPPRAHRAPAQRGDVRFALERDGVMVRTGAPCRPRPGRRRDATAPHVIDLDDGTTAEGHVILLAVGRDVPGAATSASSTTASPVSGPDAYKRDGRCASPTACGSPAIPRAPSSTPTRATTRASSRSGWRWARRSSPTTAPCPGRRTWTRSRRPWA